MRRRNVESRDGEASHATKAFDSLKRFDVYSKVDEDYLQKSQAGGTVTVAAAVIISVLFLVELREFFTVHTEDSLLVDTSWKKNMQISLNVTFPRLRCDMLQIQVLERTGQREEVQGGKLKQVGLDINGGRVLEKVAQSGGCSSCLEGEGERHKCCNTCQDLKNAYFAAGKSYSEVVSKDDRCTAAVGCHIEGELWVPRRSLAGSIHFGAGSFVREEGRNVPRLSALDDSQVTDTSHTINSLVFGQVTSSNERSHLDGTTVNDGRMLRHDYYLRLVPTILVDLWGRKVETTRQSHISVTKSTRSQAGRLMDLPGVFLSYEMMPFRMQSVEKGKPWSYIFTSTCAIIGGAFSVASLVETALSKLG